MFKPKVLLAGDQLPEPKLKWHKIRRGGQDGGQILAQCELFLVRILALTPIPSVMFILLQNDVIQDHN